MNRGHGSFRGPGPRLPGRLRIGACLSLTGRFARFGRQAADALRVWQELDGTVDLVIEDDQSSRRTVERLLPQVAERADVLLGPYATNLTRAAGRLAADHGWILWNHGGSGDDVESAHPGHLISILTPASRYAVPFVRHLSGKGLPLVIASGGGSFGRQVAAGATAMARTLEAPPDGPWALFSAGTFEDDIACVNEARRMPNPPAMICSIAAGVREFGDEVDDASGVLGIAQWFPGGEAAALGPAERDFLAAYAKAGHPAPDYPAVQAVAAAVLAAHCVRLAGTTARQAVWEAAGSLDTTTLFGAFKMDPVTGAQAAHRTVLLEWASAGGLRRCGN